MTTTSLSGSPSIWVSNKNPPKVAMPGSGSGGSAMPHANPQQETKLTCRHLMNYGPKVGISCLCQQNRISCLKISEPIRRPTSFVRQVVRSRYYRHVLQALGIMTVLVTQFGWTRQNGWALPRKTNRTWSPTSPQTSCTARFLIARCPCQLPSQVTHPHTCHPHTRLP